MASMAQENVEALPKNKSAENAEVRMSEAADVRENRRQIGRADAEPRRKGGGEFVDRSGGNPAALAGIIGAVDGERGERAEQSSALDGAAQNKLVAPPPVIGASSVGRISPAEIGGGKRSDLRSDAQLDRGRIKSVQSLAQLAEQIRLAGELIAVRVVTADGAEEDLAFHAEIVPGRDHLRYHAELRTEICGRENGLERGDAGKRC